MSILTARLEEVVEQGKIVYILMCIYWNKDQKLLIDALNMYSI